MVKTVALIGAGNIGLRHFQSFIDQNDSIELEVDVFDLDPSREKEIVSLGENPLVKTRFYTSLENGRGEYNALIVATTSGARRVVSENFLKNRKVNFLILEKVLFTHLNDFEAFNKVLEKSETKAFVNCNLRLTEFYKSLKNRLEDQVIKKIYVSGNSWGLGCNAIHFLDVASFLNGDAAISFKDCKIEKVLEAKREGYKEFIGKMVANCGDAELELTCGEGDFQLEIMIESESQNYHFKDTPDGYVIESSDPKFGKSFTQKLPYQSQMTFGVLSDLFLNGSCGLSKYDLSAIMHQGMLKSFINGLGGDKELCKVT